MNENIRELLEWAAKAAGIEIYESTDGTIQNRPVWVVRAGGGMGTMPYEEQWNPFREDAQAMRLAVKLHLIYGINTDILNHYLALELPSDDPLPATRRAIVRAAAEIGRSMK